MPTLTPTRDPPDEPSEQGTRTKTTKRKPSPGKSIAPDPEPDTATAKRISPPITQPEDQPMMSPQQRPFRTRRLPKLRRLIGILTNETSRSRKIGCPVIRRILFKKRIAGDTQQLRMDDLHGNHFAH